MRTDPGFSRNVTVASGQGTGPDEAVFAVCWPELSQKATGGWRMSGVLHGRLHFLTPRWGKPSYLSGADGGAVFSHSAAMACSSKAGAAFTKATKRSAANDSWLAVRRPRAVPRRAHGR
ncbi:hypothetical protein GCM10010211_09760 [Streptomyces albospinus]|uniref:Uncharacterized protein n=1 Tax=Streptomyces albospinus TaxID=285515 RepID=A0ABQ2US58_9ACTN|nr:hypothetical protein [Streptomyces albospinus]GGU47757.1 hypothetical protein GCM10010211_09760 [Streptomyces albospinus]